MSKSSDKKIEEDKEKIIQELLQDSRQSPFEIANKLGFSRQKAWKLIKELEKEKKIWGYTAVVDEHEKGSHIYYALIKQKVPYLENVGQIIKNIEKGNSSKLGVKLIGLYYTNGPYDCLCKFSAINIKEAKKYLGYIYREYQDLVVQVELLESVFPMVKCGKVNPNLDDLKSYSIGEGQNEVA